MDEKLTEARSTLLDEIEVARRQFRARCRVILREAYADADTISTAIGDVSVEEAFVAWTKTLKERLSLE